MSEHMVYIAIDPGAKGAIVEWAAGRIVRVSETPALPSGRLDVFALARLVAYWREHPIHIVTEIQDAFVESGPMIGARSAQTIGESVGGLRGVVAGLKAMGVDVVLTEVAPKAWQALLPPTSLVPPPRKTKSNTGATPEERAMWIKARRADSKRRSIDAARAWSGHSLRFEKSRTEQDGIADALNILRWALVNKAGSPPSAENPTPDTAPEARLPELTATTHAKARAGRPE